MSVGDSMNIFQKLFMYREMLRTNVKKEIRGKYKGSFLGVLWSFVNPLLMVTVYAIVFPYLLRIKEANYLVFLITAIIPWNFFTNVIAQGTNTVLANANIIKKVYFPREILPISVVTSGLVNFLISSLIIIIFVLASGIGLSWYILLLPIVILIQYILSLGIVFIISAINVYIRDTEYIVNFLIMMLFYLTPILYLPSMLPSKFGWILTLNPMAHLIQAYRDILYFHQMPSFNSLSIVGIFSVIILLLGYAVFKKLEKGFAEEV